MNYDKIGAFIANERKVKNLTQAKLAEKLFVSEKTISKWENGRGVPDTNVLLKLCEILDVSLNELLSGERILNEENKLNDELLINMAKELEMKNKIIWKNMWVIMIISLIPFFVGDFLIAFLVPEGILQIILIIALCIVFLVPCFYALKLEVSVGSYICKNCNHEIIPSYSEALRAMHMGTTRYLKCPNCHKRTWCKKNIK